jgi:hypothetical protein
MSSQDEANPSQREIYKLLLQLTDLLKAQITAKDIRATEYIEQEIKRLKPPFIAY